jgi:hypothetical protein
MSPRIKDIAFSSFISIAITIVFGYYFLYIGERFREPTFYIDPVRTTIIDRSSAVSAPLQLFKANGDTIKSDVISVYFYFFNQGRETIKHENIYSPILIKLSSNSQILDFKILKNARKVSGISVQMDSSLNALSVDFNALEKDDGFAGQIIFEGDKDTTISIEGGIDGVKNFEYELNSINPMYVLVALFMFLVTAYVMLLMNKRNPRSIARVLFYFSALPLLYLLLMFYKTEWFVDHKVPETLHIQQYIQHSKSSMLELPAWLGK